MFMQCIARPFIKYTPTWPRSFMPTNQSQRNLIARMKLIPVDALIRDKSLLLIDDSIVRGTTSGRIVQLLNDDEDADDLRYSVAESVDNVIQFEEYTSTLTPLQQRIAELRDIGYSDREISAICGIPYKVVALEMEGAKRSILEVYIGDAPRAA